MGRQISWNKSYEKEETLFVSGFLKPDHVCFDVGANVGYFTLLMASRVTAGEIHSFEPIPFCYHMLSCSIHLNGFANVITNNCAVGEIDGEATFYISGDSAFSSMIPHAEARRLTVAVTSIDKYVRSRNIKKIDFLKIDVEGAELQVVLGATELLADQVRRPGLIMMEIGIDGAGKISDSSIEVIRFMRNHGYAPMILRDGKLVTLDSQESSGSYNLFFCSK